MLHASDLPEGRGWSPYVWDILEGADRMTVALIEAADPVDSGDVWKKVVVPLDGTEVHEEINAKLFDAEVELMDWALAHCDERAPAPQDGAPTYRQRRTPEDSSVEPTQRLEEIFDLLRVSDPERYPVFFDHRGRRYRLRLDGMD